MGTGRDCGSERRKGNILMGREICGCESKMIRGRRIKI
jgi:hypothetical protein